MRPYSPNNIFQITKTRNGAEWGALNLNMDGSFSLNAYNAEDGQSQHILLGTTDGRLLWRGQNMIFVKESWVSGTSWYRVWSDGYIEQGGFTKTSNAVSLPKPFTTTNYTANATMVTTGFNGDVFILGKTTTTIRVKAQGNDNGDYTSKGVSWFACGY